LAEAPTGEGLRLAFEAAYARIYRHGGVMGGRAAEIVSYRVGLHVPPEAVPSLAGIGGDGFAVPEVEVEVFDEGRRQRATRMARSNIGSTPRAGPLVLEDVTATTFVPDGWAAASDAAGNLILRKAAP
jgi:N-methylhydantoinase A